MNNGHSENITVCTEERKGSPSSDGEIQASGMLEAPQVTEKPSSAPGSPKAKPRREARIIVLGKQGVGKSALVVKYVTGRFIGDYAHSDTLCVCQIEIDGKAACLQIMDTGGGMDEQADRREQIEWAEGYMLVCSVTDKESLTEVEQTFQYVNSINGRRHPVVLVANKSEMYHQRTVSEAEIRQLAKKLSCPFFETSASESFPSVLNAFSCLYREIRTQQKRRDRRRALLCMNNGTRVKISIRDTLRTLADFRRRTNTM